MQVVPLEPARRLRGDGGSAIVEAAFVAPLFMYLLMGVLEFGMYFRNWLTLGAGITDGARTLAILGNVVNTDYASLQDIKKTMAGISQNDIVKIVVFDPSSDAAGSTTAAQKANPVNATVPASCLAITTQTIGANGVTGVCNVYTPTVAWATSANVSQYACTAAGQPNYSRWWCPTDRKVAKQGANGPPSFVGLYIEVNHKFITGIFGKTRVMGQQVIVRNEPQSLQ